MQTTDIITKIKETETEAEKRINQAREEGINKLNALKHKKEQYLTDIEKNIEPKISKLKEETEKTIQGAKMMHKQELARKLEELDKISTVKTDEAVDFVINKLTQIENE